MLPFLLHMLLLFNFLRPTLQNHKVVLISPCTETTSHNRFRRRV